MTDPFERFHRLLFVLFKLRDGVSILKEADRLMASQRFAREDIDHLQRRKLKRLIENVVTRIPGYRDLVGPKTAIERGAIDLRRFPIVKKDHLRSEPGRMTAGDLNRRSLRFSETGGTTGAPLKVAKSLQTVQIGEGALMRGRLWAGVRLGAKGIIVKGSEKASLLGKMRARLVNTIHLEAFDDDPDPVRGRIDAIRRLKPVFIAGYPTTLLRLAEAADGQAIATQTILSTGEMLAGNQRRYLEQVFSARVFDHYGSNEVTSLAYECEMGRKHITEEHVVLETVDDAGDPVFEKPGRILVTDLDNFAMPFIRYDIGDMGVITREPCPCGRQHLVLKSLEGRVQDLLRARNGRVLSAMFFISRFSGLKGIQNYQIVQRSWNEIDLHYVAENSMALEEISAIRGEILNRLDTDLTVTMIEEQNIPLTPRGKRRLVVGLDSIQATAKPTETTVNGLHP